MPTTTNTDSSLWRLRALMPQRPLTHQESLRVAELQANHLLEIANVEAPGTPTEVVASLPFVHVVLRNDLPVSGLTDWYKPRWLICLNADEPGVRRRFSLMHEFKHILDHGVAEHRYPRTPYFTSEERAEQVCDYFAACVLMPKRLVKRRFFEGLSSSAELAAEFGVSPVAMRYRLEHLGLVDRRRRCIARPKGFDVTTGYARQRTPLITI